jgi:hypothetical protein
MSESAIEQSLIETLKQSELKDLTLDLGEVALDAAMHQGLVKDVPILGSLAKLCAIGATIRDYVFAKKVLAFLNGLKHIPPHKRRQMIDSLETDEAQYKTGEHCSYSWNA